MKRVIVHIDSLVLKGFRHEDRHAIADGLKAELTRLFAAPDTAARLANVGTIARLPAGKAAMDHDAKPQFVGAQTARSIAWSIKS
jgi:hypothetical protein